MFKWRSEKNRITCVFKLVFHATQVSEHGLVISVVPAENGKPTASLEKSTVKDNACYWEDPIYVTVKFLQDPKTSKIQERIYYFLISTVSPNRSLVGEFSVNIADYIATTKPRSISFPFKNSIPESYLHVTIQSVQENTNLNRVQRDLEEYKGLRNKQDDDKSLRRLFSIGDFEERTRLNFVEDQPLRKTASHSLGFNGTQRGSNGSDITLSSSDTSSGLNTPQQPQVRNGNINKYQEKMEWDLAIVPVNDSSTEYSMNSPRDFLLRSPMGLDNSVDKLRDEVVAISRRAEVSEMELKTLRKQIVKERKKGQDLFKEISSLKEEKNALKDECEMLKAFRKQSEELKVKRKFEFEGDPWTLIEVIREELNYEKEMNANLRVQLQKTDDSNEELILVVKDLEELLEKNSRGVDHLPNRSISGESSVEIGESILKCQSDDDEAQKALEDLVRQHNDSHGTNIFEQKIMDLCSEIEMYRRDKDELEMQMEQLSLDYEILKQENHEFLTRLEQIHLQEQLKIQCDGSSSYASMKEVEAQRLKLEDELKEKAEEIKDLEARYRVLEEEVQKQAERFEVDMKTIRSDQMDWQERAARVEVSLNESNAIINELESLIAKLKKERKKNLEELSRSFTSIKELETHKHILEEELEKEKQKYGDMEALVHEKMELEGRIKVLENKLIEHSEQSAIKLAYIRTLEEDLEKQVEGFEVDLEAITRAKVEQEKRAIHAEEALRLMKWKNANAASRIQDEFKRLSLEMRSSFEVNEKLASQALTEASGLRMSNHHLIDLLQKGQEDLQSIKDEYETKLNDLHHQIDTKSSQIEQMEAHNENMICDNSVNEMEGKTFEKLNLWRNLKDEKKQEVLKLKSEVEEPTVQCENFKNSLYKDELEKEKLRKQVFQLQADLKKKDEVILSIEKKFKENAEEVIVQEKAKSKSESSLKDVGSKEVVELKERVKLLEEKIESKEAVLETSTNAFLAKEKDLNEKIEELEIKLREYSQNQPGVGHDEVKQVSFGTRTVCHAEEITSANDSPEEPIITDKNSNLDSNSGIETDSQTNPSGIESGHDEKIDILLKEMVLLKEKNNSVEIELNEMQERYVEISLKFAEVECERQQQLI